MDQCEDREEGVPPSKTTLCGEHESQTKAQRNQPEPEPEPSCVSLKSDQSKEIGVDFKLRPAAAERNQPEPEPEPEPSCVSLKSDHSKGLPIGFKGQQPSAAERVDQESSEVPSGQSAQQHQTQLDSIFMLLEDNIITFVKNELKKIQKVLIGDDPESLKSQREGEELVEGEDEKQRKSSREAFLKITLHFLRKMKQEELAEHLQSKFPITYQNKLKAKLKKKFQCVFEGIPKAGNPTLLNQIYTELYITEGGAAEVVIS